MVQEGLRINPGDAPVTPKQQPHAHASAASQTEPARTPQNETATSLQKKIDPKLLAKITSELNNDFRIFNTALSFSVDNETGTTVIKILDRDTEKVIREIPPIELLRIAAKLTEVIGRLVDETA